MVWDLFPTVASIPMRQSNSPGAFERPEIAETRTQPTAYVIGFPHPLTTVCSHPTTSREFLVADSRGSIFVTDWRSDPEENAQVSWRNSSVIELLEPRALADSVSGSPARWGGSVAWRRDSIDMYVRSAPLISHMLISTSVESVQCTATGSPFGTFPSSKAANPV
jgi:hypothetical protein